MFVIEQCWQNFNPINNLKLMIKKFIRLKGKLVVIKILMIAIIDQNR